MKEDEWSRMSKRLRRIFFSALDNGKRRKIYLEKAERQTNGPWMKGYLTAMKPILGSQTAKKHTLNLNIETRSEDLRFFRQRFRNISHDESLRDSDRGYFKAWKDYVDYLLRKKKSKLLEETGSRRGSK